MSAEPTRTWDDAQKRRRRFRTIVLVVSLIAIAIELWLSALSREPPTPTPYRWPAHHVAYLHTSGGPTECTVDDGVTAPFTVSIPAAAAVGLGGRWLTADDRDAVIGTCTAPTTIVLDPGLRYSLASSDPVRYLILGVGILGIDWVVGSALVTWARSRRRVVASEEGTGRSAHGEATTDEG